MQGLRKALVAIGLVILTGPFCLYTQAQQYVDVEAERAAAASNTSAPPVDPYGAKPATAYPATSYGVNSAPVAAISQPSVPDASQTQGQNLGNLLYQVQQLQQEVMILNGKVEEQGFELRKMKEQNLERYLDLDKRVGGQAGNLVDSKAEAPASGTVTALTSPGSSYNSVPEQAGEGDAYRAAYALVRGQQFEAAVAAFKAFLGNYPAGKYAPNAHYWLGELYLVSKPADIEAARQSFMLLLSQYPDNPKIPDALYKLGKVHFMKGNREKSREYLDRVVRDYATSNSSAVKLAQDFINENF